ncbi:MAG: DMT family transporter [Lachnospiraceae bacterium]|jgi:drug/metabolite transporter (DMT)-like permease|nr:DMT family transporter [Lachnospiraceae bacterium]
MEEKVSGLGQDKYMQGVVMIVLSAFCFACMNVMVRLAGDIPSIQKSFFRNLVAAGFAGGIIWRKHVPLQVKKEARLSLAARCVFGTIGILCNFYAVDHLLVADASILNKLSPFFAIIFSYFLLRERITFFQAVCVGTAFAGCLFVVKPGFQNTALIPAMIGVCGGVGAGIAYTMVRKLGSMGIKGPIIVFYFSLSSCLIVVPWIVFHFVSMSLRQLFFLLLAGVFAAGGQFAITVAYTYASARKISIYDYSQIIFATVLGYVMFGEVPDGYSFVGYTLIVAASLVMFLYNCRAKKAGNERSGENI